MWFGVLGHLEARDDDGHPVRVGGLVRRQLLAALLSRAGAPVPVAALTEDLWGAYPPRTAPKTLQSHIVRLRDDLGRDGAAVIVTEGTSYRVELASAECDAVGFESELAAGLAALRRGDDPAAVALLDSALQHWRGEAYLDFPDAPFAMSERMRLADLRAVARESRTEAQLRMGLAATLVSDLEERVRREPYRERSWEQLILALYRSGRQADALAAYRTVRDRLAADLGVDPGPTLRALEDRILRHDPSLLVAGGTGVTGGHEFDAAVAPDACPYRGLDGYGTADAALLVGRERLAAQLIGRLAEPGVVVVTGPSGSGKSSLVRAGVVPSLRAGGLPGSARWRVEVATPGDRPSAERVDVLVLDQAEELFTLLDSSSRDEMVERLRQFVERDGRLIVVVRGDVFTALVQVPWLTQFAERAPFLVGPMRPDELSRVVTEPARRAGVRVAPEVRDAVLEASAGQAQPLPLISLALVGAWEHRDGDVITLESYAAGGGVAGALEASAEAVYAAMPPNARVAARRLLVRMAVREGAGWARRPLPRSAVTDPDSAAALDALVAGRLVTVGAERIEVSHDTLLVRWPRLRDWLSERVAAAELLDHLAAAAGSWVAAGRPDTDLYRGPRLQAALDWRVEHTDDPSDDEAAFLTASADAAGAELRDARARALVLAQGRRRLVWAIAGLVVALLGALVAGGFTIAARTAANRSAADARQKALSADARRIAALSATSPDAATAALLAAAGYRLQPGTETRGALLSALQRGQSALYRIQAPRRLIRLVTTPDGSRLYALDSSGAVQVIDTVTRTVVRPYSLSVEDLTGVTSNGKDLVGLVDPPQGGFAELALVNTSTGAITHTIDPAPATDLDPAAMSADGRWVVDVPSTDRHSPGNTLTVYDTTHPSGSGRSLRLRAEIVQTAAADHRVFAETADRRAYLIDPSSMKIVQRSRNADLPTAKELEGGVRTVLTPDGSRLAYPAPGDGRTPDVLDTARLSATPRALPAQPQPITVMAFSRDGTRLAVGGLGGSLNVYNAADGELDSTLAGHSGAVLGAAWAVGASGGALFTDGLDSQVVSWNVGSGTPLLHTVGPSLATADFATRSGDMVFGGDPHLGSLDPGSEVSLFTLDLRTETWRSWPAHMTDPEIEAFVSASADRARGILTTQNVIDNSTRWRLWDLRTGALLATIRPPSSADQRHYLAALISPDGHTAVVALGDSRLGVIALPSGRLQRTIPVAFAEPGSARLVVEPYAFAPDGSVLVGARDPGPGGSSDSPTNDRLGMVNLATGRITAQTGLGDNVMSSVGWSHDGRLLVVGTESGTIDLFDATDMHLTREASNSQSGFVLAVSFAPDDKTILSSGTDAVMNFWDVATMIRIGPRVTVPTSSAWWWAWYRSDGQAAGLAPDGSKPTKDDNRTFLFPAHDSDWLRLTCSLTTSDMSRAQWRAYVGTVAPYRHVCPS